MKIGNISCKYTNIVFYKPSSLTVGVKGNHLRDTGSIPANDSHFFCSSLLSLALSHRRIPRPRTDWRDGIGPERSARRAGAAINANITKAMRCFLHKTIHGLYQFTTLYGKTEGNIIRLLRFKQITRTLKEKLSQKQVFVGRDRQKLIYVQNL